MSVLEDEKEKKEIKNIRDTRSQRTCKIPDVKVNSNISLSGLERMMVFSIP